MSTRSTLTTAASFGSETLAQRSRQGSRAVTSARSASAAPPVVDLATRSLFIDAMIDGVTKKHFVYSLNVDTGVTNPNWPVDLNVSVPGLLLMCKTSAADSPL